MVPDAMGGRPVSHWHGSVLTLNSLTSAPRNICLRTNVNLGL